MTNNLMFVTRDLLHVLHAMSGRTRLWREGTRGGGESRLRDLDELFNVYGWI